MPLDELKKTMSLPVIAGIDVRFDQTHDLLRRAQFAWIASGTATLEAALLGTPHALAYRTSGLTYFLAKQFVKVKFIGLPNLLLDREVVPELIQEGLHAKALLEHSNLDWSAQQSISTNSEAFLEALAHRHAWRQVLRCFEPQP